MEATLTKSTNNPPTKTMIIKSPENPETSRPIYLYTNNPLKGTNNKLIQREEPCTINDKITNPKNNSLIILLW